MILSIILLIIGLVALVKGADYMVDGASNLAIKNNVSKLAVGLTVVAFGTSAPELVVNTVAALGGYYDIVFGNVLGSNNFNLFIVLGIVGLVAPLAVKRTTTWREIPISLFAALVLIVMVNGATLFGNGDNHVSRIDGILLLLMFVAFIFYVYKQMKASPQELEENTGEDLSTFKTWLFIIGGLVGLVIGGKMVVDNGVNIAEALGISEKIIGLTIIAFGTSLPELTTSLVAVKKNNTDIAVGNIIGSNIFNIFLILGVSSLIKPLTFNPTMNMDIMLIIAGTMFLFIAMFTGKKNQLDRWEAAIFLIAYLGYMGWLIAQELT